MDVPYGQWFAERYIEHDAQPPEVWALGPVALTAEETADGVFIKRLDGVSGRVAHKHAKSASLATGVPFYIRFAMFSIQSR